MKLIKQAVIILMLLNLTGCWSKVELDELTFIYGLYIDVGKEPGTVEVSISSPLPNRLMSGTQAGSGTGDGKAYTLVSKTARTIQDATIMIQKIFHAIWRSPISKLSSWERNMPSRNREGAGMVRKKT